MPGRRQLNAMTPAEVIAPQSPSGEMLPHFDYGDLFPYVADQMRDHASRIFKIRRASVLEVGRELLAAKALVEHRYFSEWVRTACLMHIRTAERAMQAVKLVAKNDNLSYLPPDGLLALASRSTPEPIVSKIMEEISAGVRPTAAEIKRRIAEVKSAAKRVRTQLREGVEFQGNEHRSTARALATDELVGMLIAWDRIDEFLAALKKVDLIRVVEAVKECRERSVEVHELGPDEPPRKMAGNSKCTTGLAAAGTGQLTSAEPEFDELSEADLAVPAVLPVSPPATPVVPTHCIETVATGAAQGPSERDAPSAQDQQIEGSAEPPDTARAPLAAVKLLDGEPAQQATPPKSGQENGHAQTQDWIEQPASAGSQLSPNTQAETATDDGPGAMANEALPESTETSAGISAEELMAIFEDLKSNTQFYARQSVLGGILEKHHIVTERLVPFRAAANEASEVERQRFLEMSAGLTAQH